MRVGIDSPDSSHVRLFTEAFEDSDRIRVTSMLGPGSIRDRQVIFDFAQEHGLTIHEERERFADSVGSVLLLGVDWSAHVDRALYYLGHGKRIYIDKPVTGNFADTIRLRELVIQYPRQIFGGSALPHHHAFARYLESFTFFAKQDNVEVEIFGSMDS